MTFTQVISGKVWAELPISSSGQITALSTSSHPLYIYTDHCFLPPHLNNWLTLPSNAPPSDEVPPHPGFILATNQTHTHTGARTTHFGSIHKKTDSSMSCLNVLTESMFPDTEDVSHFHQHQSVLIMFSVKSVYFELL